MEQQELGQWDDVEKEEISVADLDGAITEMRETRTDYKAKKKVSSEAHAKYKKATDVVIDMMKRAKKSNYQVDGIGKVVVYDTCKVKMPSDHDNKGKLFKWLNDNLGADGFLTYATINYNSLNSLFNEHTTINAEKGESFTMPGVAEPTSESNIRFTRS